MNLFKTDIDKKKVVELIRTIIKGIGTDLEPFVAHKSGISNIVLEENDFGKKFASAGLKDIPDLDFSDFNKTVLKFSLPDGDYTAKVEHNEFTLKKLPKEKLAAIYDSFNKEDLSVVLVDNEEKDEIAVKNIIEKFVVEDVKLFNAGSSSTYESTVICVGFDGAYCVDRDLGWLLFGFISKQMNYIRPSESNMLLDVFMLNGPVRFPNLESVMRLEMMQTFKILKEHGHDVNNKVESNDMDNYLYYVEKGDIQGNVYISQNHMFLVARNTKTDVIKVWETMRLDPDWMVYVYEDAMTDENDNLVFNVADYLQNFVNARYSNKYDYPFEFNADGYRKSVDKLLEDFDSYNELVYDSERGYIPEKFMSFNALAQELSYSNNLMTSEYNVPKERLVLTDMDISSPEYYIRSSTSSLSTNRANALFHLFLVSGNGYHWNGLTFDNGEVLYKDYNPNEKENDYGPLEASRPFAFGKCSHLFNLPEGLSKEWSKVVFEMIVYLKDWINNNPENEEGNIVKDDLDKLFETYYDEEVFNKIKSFS